MLRRMRRAPSVLVALSAAVAELVILAAAGNQWVVDHLIRHQADNELPRERLLKSTLTAFSWRFTPESHQRMIWLGGLVATVGLVVFVFLLVLLFVGPMRPSRRFLPVFLGTWGIVVALTQLAAIGFAMTAFGNLFDGGRDPDGLGRYWYSVFHGPTGESVLFGGASGLVVALVAAIFAAAGSSEESDDPFGLGHDERDGSRGYAPGELSASPTSATSVWQSSDEATRSWPAAEQTTTSWSPQTTTAGRWPAGSDTNTESRRASDDDAPTSTWPKSETRPSYSRPTEAPAGSSGATASWPEQEDRPRYPRSGDPPTGS